MNAKVPVSLPELRRQARRLLQHAQQDEPQAAARLARLRGLSAVPTAELPTRARLKHALAAVAEDAGFESWMAAKFALAPDEPLPMWDKSLELLLNRWFARYAEARASLDAEGGFLLPYQTQFFICEAEGVRMLGLDPEDPDWGRIGHDWVRPRQLVAFARLRDKRRAALRP